MSINTIRFTHTAIAPPVPVVMALPTKPYGRRELAVYDSNGHLITFAPRVEGA